MIDAPQEILDSIERIKTTATPRLLVDAARARGWEVTYGADRRLIYLHMPGGRKTLLFGINTTLNSYAGSVIATSKFLSDTVIREIAPNILTPTIEVNEFGQAAIDFLHEHGSIVVKPNGGAHGKGITLDIQTEDRLRDILQEGLNSGSPKLLLQKYVQGGDFRLLVVGDKVVAAVRREPASVVGDGTHTVAELISASNDAPRTEEMIGTLSLIPEAEAATFLGDKIDRVPDAGEKVQVIAVANISKGGKAIDQTDFIPQKLADITVAIARQIGLGIMAADFLIPGTSESLEVEKAVLLEINSQPGIRMHHFPSEGNSRDVAGAILGELEKH